MANGAALPAETDTVELGGEPSSGDIPAASRAATRSITSGTTALACDERIYGRYYSSQGNH